MSYTAYRIDWTESERGWGQRPDGYSLHRDLESAQTAIREHWASYEKAYGNRTPDCYSFPSDPRRVEVSLDEWTMVQVQAEGSYWSR